MDKIAYKLIRSRRKTLALHITENGLEVRAPLKLPQKEIDRFITARTGWIQKHLASMRERQREKAGFELDYGSSVLLLGEEYVIRPGQDRLAPPHAEIAEIDTRSRTDEDPAGCILMPPGLAPAQILPLMVACYKEAARRIVPGRVTVLAKMMGVRPASVRVGSAFSRWGSCSAQGRLHFTWLLAMADSDIIDYVVVHELAHLKHFNHAPAFWELVEKYAPNHAEQRGKLKALHRRVIRENWKQCQDR
jgi:predicted metal-dependent hydrolase